MKALLLKDFLTLAKMIRTILLIMLALSFVPQLNMAVFFMVYSAMLPITAMGYDDRTKWHLQAAMMPYRPWEIVLGKYVLGYLILAAASALALLAGAIVGQVTGSPLTAEQCLTMVIYALSVTVFMAVSLPIIFRFGAEKGRIAMGIGLGVCIGVFFALVPLLTDHLDAVMLTMGQVTALVAAFAILTNLLSILLSIRFYRKKMS